MARSLWSGALSFGLVSVPVAMHSAVRDLDVHFRQLHEPDGSPIETRRVCAHEGREVPWSEIAKGYELEDGRWVLLSDEDLAAAAPRKSRTIDIEWFVEEKQIDPVYLDRPYVLVPSEESAGRAYALLGEAMGRAGKVALGRFVLHAKEHLVSIRPRGKLLTLTTMRFHDEVRSSIDIAEGIDGALAPTPEQVENAMAIIEELEVPFDPSSYRDEHRAHLERVIKRKQKGQKISVPAAVGKPAKPTPTAPDLMGALEQSLARIRGEAGVARGEAGGAAKTKTTKAKKAKKAQASPRASSSSGSRARRS
jgi:DNA end-binding protein Ku